jgi:uncharacterized protein (TIGR02646 family)
LKKINKSPAPNELTNYLQSNPTDTWQEFRSHNAGVDYSNLKTRIFDTDQGELCAYCETKADSSNPTKRRVEHIHNKSPHLQPPNTHNWALDWNNVIGVCVGGNDSDKATHPLPQNLSCDSYKEHKNISHNDILNPLNIQANPSLFGFDKSNGKLIVNESIEDGALKELVQKTIDNLNLNCDRLCTNRLKIFTEYNQELKKARVTNNTKVFEILPQKWFSKKWPSFFTTRRILLGDHAENYLQGINYNG